MNEEEKTPPRDVVIPFRKLLSYCSVECYFFHSSRDKCFNRENSLNVHATRVAAVYTYKSLHYDIPLKDIIIIIVNTMKIASFIKKINK